MKLGIIGDFDQNFQPHRATNEALEVLRPLLNFTLEYEWIPTETIEAQFEAITFGFTALWIAPGSPYKNMEGALKIIRYARLHNVPTLGTCGGFQHMVIEFARNVVGIKDAKHAEYDPYSSKLVINPLSCDLKGKILEIDITQTESLTFKAFNTNRIREKYYCNFGLNPEYQNEIHTHGFQIVGTDIHKEARILELKDHRFFIATLFVPQDNCTTDHPHPLLHAFLKTAGE